MIKQFCIATHSITARSIEQHGRDIAEYLEQTPDKDFPLLRFQKGTNQSETLGRVISLQRALAMIESRKHRGQTTSCAHIAARSFQQKMKAGHDYFETSGNDIAFVTKRAEGDLPLSVIAVVSPDFFVENRNIAAAALPATQPRRGASTSLNMDDDAFQVAPNTFTKHSAEIERRTAAGEAVFSHDGAYCAVPVQTALLLKQHLFPGDESIIVDTDTKQTADNGLRYIDSLLEDGKFLRVTKFRTGHPVYTIIPGALGEFLNMNAANGVGIKPQKSLRVEFNVRASVHTDFNGKFFVHVIPHQEKAKHNGEIKIEIPKGQASLARKALLSDAPIDLAGHTMHLDSTHQRRLKHQDKSCIHVDSDATLSMTINANGRVSDLKLAFATQRDILALGLQRAGQRASVCINSQVYGLKRN